MRLVDNLCVFVLASHDSCAIELCELILWVTACLEVLLETWICEKIWRNNQKFTGQINMIGNVTDGAVHVQENSILELYTADQ